jgi:hypothetical protein
VRVRKGEARRCAQKRGRNSKTRGDGSYGRQAVRESVHRSAPPERWIHAGILLLGGKKLAMVDDDEDEQQTQTQTQSRGGFEGCTNPDAHISRPSMRKQEVVM